MGSLLGWKSLLTNLRTSEDCHVIAMSDHRSASSSSNLMLTFPTAASPSSTSLTLLLGFGADAAVESAMEVGDDGSGLLARKLRPTPYADSLGCC